jgi:hypothetical protein
VTDNFTRLRLLIVTAVFVDAPLHLRRCDPARKWDPDLLAAIAGIGATPALGLMAVDHDPFAEVQ